MPQQRGLSPFSDGLTSVDQRVMGAPWLAQWGGGGGGGGTITDNQEYITLKQRYNSPHR